MTIPRNQIDDIWRVFACPKCGKVNWRKMFTMAELEEYSLHCDGIDCGEVVVVQGWEESKS